MHQLFMRTALSLAFLLSTSGTLHAATERDRVVDETLSQLKAQYVHPATYPAIEQHVRKHQEAGDYTSAVSEEEFARLLTAHMQEISHDKHMRLKFQPDVRSLRPSANASTPAKRALERRENYGLQKVEILPGNVGYVDIVKFHDTAEGARETIGAAMGFVAHTDALIIDLRNNRGGGEAMQLLASYFFKHQFTVMELHYRHDGVYKARTLTRIPGKRYLDKPVYLLTSDRTFSAGEAFSYAMKSLKRATLVGATTRGGGNPVTMFPLRRDYLLSVPTGVSVSPVDGGSWEGVGVQPDVAVDEASALDVAHRQALQTLHERSKDGTVRASLEKHIAALERR